MQTTGIGSLPYLQVEAALDYSFRHDLPFLPQLPLKSPAELMGYQSLAGFPGLGLKGNKAVLDLALYQQGAKGSLLPTALEFACFTPFLQKLSELKTTKAKVQIAGPLSFTSMVTLSSGEKLGLYPVIRMEMLEWAKAKGLALIESLKQKNIAPVIFIDEPMLSVFSVVNTQFMLALSDLSSMVTTFQGAGAEVGLHCCGNTCWDEILKLPLNYLSFDCALSGSKILEQKDALEAYKKQGGKLSFGITATDVFQPWANYLEGSLVSAPCGLAYKTPEQAESTLAMIRLATLVQV